MSSPSVDIIEAERLRLQQKLDAAKTQDERNKLGQFATPTDLAVEILRYARTLIPDSEPIRFLDPAFGTGSFYSALLHAFPRDQIERACCYEIDHHYGESASQLWDDDLLELNLVDFTQVRPPDSDTDKFNLVICNPPYVRHHHLSSNDKIRLRQFVARQINYRLNGLAGLYCYFLLLSQRSMSPDGLAGWLIPGEFLDVNYGKEVKQFLLEKVTLLHIHRFNPQQTQFEDALVSSVVVWFRNAPPNSTHQIKFSYGGTLLTPEKSIHHLITTLKPDGKWTRLPVGVVQSEDPRKEAEELKLSDLFTIKRGIATGANKFFILTTLQITEFNLPQECFRPILPSPRFLEEEEIEADDQGYPGIQKQLFLLDCNLPEAIVEQKYPSLWRYLQSGIEQGIHQQYLCRHRSPWYAQESRPTAPILCTYMGRSIESRPNPFRFILNHSKATAPNVYLLLYPKSTLARQLKDNPPLLRSIWQALQKISPNDLIAAGRVYGGGLHKLEPNELMQVKIRVNGIFEMDQPSNGMQLSLF